MIKNKFLITKKMLLQKTKVKTLIKSPIAIKVGIITLVVLGFGLAALATAKVSSTKAPCKQNKQITLAAEPRNSVAKLWFAVTDDNSGQIIGCDDFEGGRVCEFTADTKVQAEITAKSNENSLASNSKGAYVITALEGCTNPKGIGTTFATCDASKSTKIKATLSSSIITVTVLKSGNGDGSISGDINCITNVASSSGKNLCEKTFPAGSRLSLKAKADKSSTFTGWSGCKIESNNGDCIIDSLTKNPTQVTATFKKNITCTGNSSTACGDKCVNLKTDSENCGTCGKVCGDEEKCTNGVCMGDCFDSDNGYTPFKFGYVEWYDREGNKTKTEDKCLPDSNILMEVVCDKNGFADNSKTTRCENGCQNGACQVGSTGCKINGLPGTDCNGKCINLKTDSKNCGSCGTDCESGQSCKNGQCSCPLGKTLCDGKCVNTNADGGNCGKCGNICSGGKACLLGNCSCTAGKKFCAESNSCVGLLDPCCGGSLSNCSNKCVNLQNDNKNCGSCNKNCTTEGKVCNNGSCVCSLGNEWCSASSKCSSKNKLMGSACKCDFECASNVCNGNNCCAAGWKACNGRCINPKTDAANCGGCGVATCNNGSSCVNGTCKCPIGRKACGSGSSLKCVGILQKC